VGERNSITARPIPRRSSRDRSNLVESHAKAEKGEEPVKSKCGMESFNYGRSSMITSGKLSRGGNLRRERKRDIDSKVRSLGQAHHSKAKPPTNLRGGGSSLKESWISKETEASEK